MSSKKAINKFKFITVLNCTFIGVRTDSYKQLMDRVRTVSQKHSIPTKLQHINKVEDILQTNARAIPSIHIMPGNLLLVDPSSIELEEVMLKKLIIKNELL